MKELVLQYLPYWGYCSIISALWCSVCCGYQMAKDSHKKFDIGDQFLGCLIILVISTIMGPLGVAFWIGDLIFELRKDKSK